jgi:hypothetical protein
MSILGIKEWFSIFGEVLVNVDKPLEMLEDKVLVPRVRELYPTCRI